MEGTFLWELQQFDLVRINLLKCVIIIKQKTSKTSSLLAALPSRGVYTSQGNTHKWIIILVFGLRNIYFLAYNANCYTAFFA